MRRAALYIAFVIVVGLASWAIAKATVNEAVAETDAAVVETATIGYWNAIDGCIRGNETIRQPLHDFFVAFYSDESQEHDDPEVAEAARIARNKTTAQQCVEVVEKVGPAGEYVPPEER